MKSEYINATHLRHTLISSKAEFAQIEQKWNQTTSIELVLRKGKKSALTILRVEWATTRPLKMLIFYTDNPIGEISQESNGIDMPMMGDFSQKRRVLEQDQQAVLLEVYDRRVLSQNH